MLARCTDWYIIEFGASSNYWTTNFPIETKYRWWVISFTWVIGLLRSCCAWVGRLCSCSSALVFIQNLRHRDLWDETATFEGIYMHHVVKLFLLGGWPFGHDGFTWCARGTCVCVCIYIYIYICTAIYMGTIIGTSQVRVCPLWDCETSVHIYCTRGRHIILIFMLLILLLLYFVSSFDVTHIECGFMLLFLFQNSYWHFYKQAGVRILGLE